MNKLSYFVKYKELIDNINIDNDSERFTNTLSKTMSILSTDKNDINLFKKQYKTISNEISTFNKLLNDFKSDVEKELREKELHYLNKSQQLYDETNDEPEYIIKRFTKHKLITNKEHVWTNQYSLSYVWPWKLSKIFYAEYGAWADREYMSLTDDWSHTIEGTHALFCALGD